MSHKVRFVSPLDLLLYFRSLGFADGVTNLDLANMAANATERFVPAGAYLLKADEPLEKVFITVEGRIEIDAGTYTDIVEPPSGINWLQLHGGFQTNRPARALVDSLVLEIDASRQIETLERNPRLIEHTLKNYAEYILLLRQGLPMHPENATPAEIGEPPARKLTLIERLSQVTGPGDIWEFANLDAVLTIVRAMDQTSFKKGDVLWERGARSPYLWSLVCGKVACTSADGVSVEVGAGFGLGIYDAIARAPRAFRAVATHDGVALRSNIDELLAVLENHSDMAMSVLSMLARVLSSAYDADQIRRQESGEPPLPAVGTQIRASEESEPARAR